MVGGGWVMLLGGVAGALWWVDACRGLAVGVGCDCPVQYCSFGALRGLGLCPRSVGLVGRGLPAMDRRRVVRLRIASTRWLLRVPPSTLAARPPRTVAYPPVFSVRPLAVPYVPPHKWWRGWCSVCRQLACRTQCRAASSPILRLRSEALTSSGQGTGTVSVR